MNATRTGPSWDAFLKRNRLVSITQESAERFLVASESGHTYTVRLIPSMDRNGSYYTSERCDCPARGTCRHRTAVLDMLHAEAIVAARAGETDSIERVERIV